MYIEKLIFKKDFRTFKEGDEILFDKYTALVGNNGSGKSTILDILRTHFKLKDRSYSKRNTEEDVFEVIKTDLIPEKVVYLDVYGDDVKSKSQFGEDMFFQIKTMAMSSGTASIHQLHNLKLKGVKNHLIIIDEPCRGISLYWQYIYAMFFKELSIDNQIIISTHSEKIMKKCNHLYSTEHKKVFENTDDFLDEHLKLLFPPNQS